jgi:hypothetical protein
VIEIPMNERVLNILFAAMPEDQRAVLCTVGGDPGTVDRWPGIAWRHGGKCPLHPLANNYCAVSGFTANEKGEYRRRKEQFGGLYVLMVDDIGTKISPSAIPRSVVPTLLVETSPGNYQAMFRLREPVFDYVLADALIRGLTTSVTGGGPDPGMLGVTRVFRLPQGINGKAKYRKDGQPFTCRVASWSPDTVVDAQELARAFRVVLTRKSYVEPDTAVTLERKRGFQLVTDGLKLLGRVKGRGRNWVDVTCPWVEEHTDRATTGSAVALPSKENGWFGGYRCHHGHCDGRGWGDLEDWVSDQVVALGNQTRGPYRIG